MNQHIPSSGAASFMWVTAVARADSRVSASTLFLMAAACARFCLSLPKEETIKSLISDLVRFEGDSCETSVSDFPV